MDEDSKILLIVLTIGVVISLILSIAMLVNVGRIQIDEDKIVSEVVNQIGQMPTPEQVAALIPSIEIPEITMPEIPEFKSDEKVQELWNTEYADEIELLEDEAEIVAIEQFGEDNEYFNGFFYEDDAVFDLVTNEVECDGDCVVEYIKEYDDREVNVINLGLNDLDDRLIELSTVIRVKVFTDEDDDSEYFFEKIYIDSTVTSDEYLEAEVIYSL